MGNNVEHSVTIIPEEMTAIDHKLNGIEAALPDIMGHLRQVFKSGFGQQESVQEKTHGDFVTETDFQIERMFREWVHTHYPDHAVYGEEEQGVEEEVPEWLWAIDPIDGTNNYQFGNTDTSIVISLRYKGQPVLAICDLPLKNEEGLQYSAMLGKGMKRNEIEVHATKADNLKYVPLVTTKLDTPRRMMSMLGDVWDSVAGVHMNMSSVYEACRVASAEIGVGVFYGNGPHEWPAMYLFAKESGCRLGDLGNVDQEFSLQGMGNRNILIAGNQSLYNQAKMLVHVPEAL